MTDSPSRRHAAASREWLWALVAIAAIEVLHGGRNLFLGCVPYDERYIHLPNLVFSWRCLTEGVLPLWNPYAFLGIPHLASHHTAVLYPPVYLFMALWSPFRAFSLMQSAHYIVLGMGGWALLRKGWGLMRWSALAGGVMVMLSGAAVVQEAHPPFVWAFTWVPWMLWVQRRLLAGKPGSGPALAALLAVQIGAGYMQLTVMTCMVLVAEALALQIRRPWKKSATLLALLLLALAVGAGLQAVQFFSTRDMLPMTFRGRPNFEGFTQLGYTLAQAPALLFPMLFGAYGSQALIHQNYFLDGYQIEMVGSMGAVAWLGILLLALSRPAPGLHFHPLRRRSIYFWSALGVFAFSMLFGRYSPLAHVLFRVPVYNLFRIQNRWLIFMDLAIALLAASGFDKIERAVQRGYKPSIRWPFAAGAALLVLALPLLWAWMRLAVRYDGLQLLDRSWGWFFAHWLRPGNPALWLPLAFGLAALAVLLFVRLWPLGLGWWMALWVGLFALEQGVLCMNGVYRGCWPPKGATAPGNESAQLMLDWNQGQADRFRIVTITGKNIFLNDETMPFYLPQLSGLYTAGGNWPLVSLEHHYVLRYANSGETNDPIGLLRHPWILSMLNVRYLLVGPWSDGRNPREWTPAFPEPPLLKEMTEPGTYPFLERRAQTRRGVTILENTEALPRAWSVGRARKVKDFGEVVAALWSDTEPFDPKAEALVQLGKHERLPQSDGFSTATVRITRRTYDRLWLDVDAPAGPAFVVVSEAWYPGWWATLDGEKNIPIWRVDGLLRGLIVPQGHHEIYMRFLPEGFKRGAVASAGFVIVWIAWTAWEMRRRNRPKPQGPATQ